MEILIPSYEGVAGSLIEREGFKAYVSIFWEIAEPGTKFVDNWHVDYLCFACQQTIIDRVVKRAYINLPARWGKSTILSVLAQSYKWTLQPGHRFMSASHDPRLVERDALKIMNVVESPLHRTLFPHVQFDGAIQALKQLKTTEGGRRLGTTPQSSGGTGFGSHTQVLDDILKVEDAFSKPKMEQRARWITQTMANRIDGDPEDFVRVLTMQRLHDMDPTSICEALGWEGYIIPAGERNSKGVFISSNFPQRWPVSALNEQAKELQSPDAVAAQMQQDPNPDKGGFVEKAWIDRYEALPEREQFLRWFQVWDLGFKSKNKAAHSRVAAILCFTFEHKYQVPETDQVHRVQHLYIHDFRANWWNYPDTKENFLRLQLDSSWKRAGRIYVEDAANGPALIAEIKQPDMKRFTGDELVAVNQCKRKLIPFNPGTVPGFKGSHSKEERFSIQSDKVRAGRLHVRVGLDELIDEVVGFPNKKTDDLADVSAKALSVLDSGVLAGKRDAMKRILGIG